MLQNLLYDEGFVWIAFRIVATLLATVLVTQIFRMTWRKLSNDKIKIHHRFIKNTLSIVIWMVGIAMALSWLPHFTDTATAVFAGSGLLILTVGLAAQESLGNTFSGLFISIFKPFEVGDRVNLASSNITGFIEDINLRHTVIRTFTNSRIIVPNSVMNKELIENANYFNPRAANFIDVTVTYDSDVTAACDIMARIIGDHPDFVDNRAPEKQAGPKVPVFIRSLEFHGVELRASMWTETIANNFAACSDVRRDILREFEKANIRIASSKVMDVFLKEK